MAAAPHITMPRPATTTVSDYPPREYRLPVIIEARMRSDGGWVTVCIRNISAHGLMGQTGMPPPPGSYIEIHRGAHTIIGRTAWSRGRKFGVRTQDALDIDAIISDPVPAVRGPARLPDGRIIAERRSDVRRPPVSETYDDSVRFSRKFQSLVFLATGIVAAWLLAQTLYLLLADVAGVAGKSLG